ncbi:MAG: hypothetical protein ACRDK5_08680, partial [Solirubrobacterales bacterium]
MLQRLPERIASYRGMRLVKHGDAHRAQLTGDREGNLQRAIACYSEAQRFLTAEAAPLEYATLQRTLGEAYAELPTGDRTANLERAIAC